MGIRQEIESQVGTVDQGKWFMRTNTDIALVLTLLGAVTVGSASDKVQNDVDSRFPDSTHFKRSIERAKLAAKERGKRMQARTERIALVFRHHILGAGDGAHRRERLPTGRMRDALNGLAEEVDADG
jgi:hypothetical protein